MLVKDLMLPGYREWDFELIDEYFVARDVAAITNILLSPSSLEDNQIWHFTKNGIYVVKSAYRLAMNLFSTDVEPASGHWSKL